MAIPARMSIVTLGVGDLQRSVAFYQALGWERCESSNEQIAWFRTADSYLGLFPFEHLAGDAALPGTPSQGFGGVTLAINVETEQAVSAGLEEAVQAGGRLLKPASKADWGGVSGYFADPDGYPWEVCYNPFFPIGPDGRITIP
ncbi:MAG: VOC family protein [Dehalococcoidia bacterium]